MIGIMALSGVVMVLAIFVTLARVMDVRVVLGYATEIDVLFSVLLLVMFSGTYMGLLSAAFAGLTLAVCLSVGRYTVGYTRFKLVRYGRKIGIARVKTDAVWKDFIQELVDRCTQLVPSSK